MRNFGRLFVLAVVLVFVSTAGLGCGPGLHEPKAASPRNVILLVGDGMGFGHVKAGGLYANGREGSLFLETLPYRAEVVTTPVAAPNARPGREPVTDSAAAATALATGHKVYNGVVSMARPGDGSAYRTVLETFASQGKSTGLVSTAFITDATPAAFGAHAAARGNRAEIVDCYLKTVRPDVIMGGGDPDKKAGLTAEAVQAAGYRLVTDRKSLLALKTRRSGRVFGLFGPNNMPYEAQKAAAATQPVEPDPRQMPSLSEMAGVALKIVSANRKGFFLLIEGALIDKSANKKGEDRCIPEVVEFDRTVQRVMKWAERRKDTLVLVVADHETGGLKVVAGNGAGRIPQLAWTTTSHTSAHVPLFAWGVGARKVAGTLDNTDVYRLMTGTFTTSSAARPAAEAAVPAAAGAAAE